MKPFKVYPYDLSEMLGYKFKSKNVKSSVIIHIYAWNFYVRFKEKNLEDYNETLSQDEYYVMGRF